MCRDRQRQRQRERERQRQTDSADATIDRVCKSEQTDSLCKQSVRTDSRDRAGREGENRLKTVTDRESQTDSTP